MNLHPACEICSKNPTILYVIKDKVWKSLFNDSGVICLECFRNILKRNITLEDLDFKATGNYFYFAFPWVLDIVNEGKNLTHMCVNYLRWYIKEFDDEPYFGIYLGVNRTRNYVPQHIGHRRYIETYFSRFEKAEDKVKTLLNLNNL